jgi:uroporphyrinogen decarboxylase
MRDRSPTHVDELVSKGDEVIRRERVKTAIAHRQPDKVPWDLGMGGRLQEMLVAYYGSEENVPQLGNHMAHVPTQTPEGEPSAEEIAPGIWRDRFGVVWNRNAASGTIGLVQEHPLRTRSLDGYEFPPPLGPKTFELYLESIEQRQEYFLVAGIGFSLFERAWTLRGMEELLIDMVEAPGFVDELLDAITEWNLTLIRKMVTYDIDCVRLGDDWGAQRGLIMGPACWRRFLKPRLARMFEAIHAGGKATMIHSDGDIQAILPDLVAIGLDIYNPLQPDVMDPYKVKRGHGDHLSFHGGVSVQQFLPFATAQEVRREVRRMLTELGAGGGFIIAPTHSILEDVPVENLAALLETVAEQ